MSPTNGSQKLTREELIAIVQRLLAGEETSEAEQDARLEILNEHFEHPAPSDLLFWPDDVPGFGKESPTAEEIVDFGLSYQRRLIPREELIKLVQANMESYNGWMTQLNADQFYLMSENLKGYEVNHLCLWGRRRGLGADELVDLALSGGLHSDPDFQESLAATRPDEDHGADVEETRDRDGLMSLPSERLDSQGNDERSPADG
ncbi:bacteriocin immunity protein [Planctomyces sp. SH-PL62]|uniref:bacteriocin immunity protein n=1 Tax=Planctomyces sp. SH-PL62 TaxID=1636152 RepID=UPI00078E94AA|nr:bacteriocin immunity protein [Planctomyces sp. SH-PL62]AMV38087.1 hypothetical protein VT85_11660 [Planctomyces sp. SH-PL62]